MSFISRNVNTHHHKKLSSWIKVAIGTWNSIGDPSVYGSTELCIENGLRFIDELQKTSGIRITVSHFIGKAVAETLRRHPDLNSLLRFGKLYPRKNVDLFFQVA